ncbi:hypothetical protein D3C78_1170810 [compost metagenome]
MNLARAALEQGVAQFGFKVADGHADSGWYPAKGACRSGKRTPVEHGEEQLDVVAGKVHVGLLSVNLKATDFVCQ